MPNPCRQRSFWARIKLSVQNFNCLAAVSFLKSLSSRFIKDYSMYSSKNIFGSIHRTVQFSKNDRNLLSRWPALLPVLYFSIAFQRCQTRFWRFLNFLHHHLRLLFGDSEHEFLICHRFGDCQINFSEIFNFFWLAELTTVTGIGHRLFNLTGLSSFANCFLTFFRFSSHPFLALVAARSGRKSF